MSRPHCYPWGSKRGQEAYHVADVMLHVGTPGFKELKVLTLVLFGELWQTAGPVQVSL